MLQNSSFTDGRVIFSRNSLSLYGVGYAAPTPVLDDTAEHWARADIDFVVSRGLFDLKRIPPERKMLIWITEKTSLPPSKRASPTLYNLYFASAS